MTQLFKPRKKKKRNLNKTKEKLALFFTAIASFSEADLWIVSPTSEQGVASMLCAFVSRDREILGSNLNKKF